MKVNLLFIMDKFITCIGKIVKNFDGGYLHACFTQRGVLLYLKAPLSSS